MEVDRLILRSNLLCLTFRISIVFFLNLSCNKAHEQCSNLDNFFTEFTRILLERSNLESDHTYLVKEFMGVNDLYNKDIDSIKAMGFNEWLCNPKELSISSV